MIEKKPIIVCDIEVSPNAFLIGFKSLNKGNVVLFDVFGEDETLTSEQIKRIKVIMAKYTIVTFNGVKYDIPMILKSLCKTSCKELFKVSNIIIKENYPQWKSLRDFGLTYPRNLVHIDLIEPAPGVGVSLKLYGTRLHSKKLQDLPYEYDKFLTEEEFENIKLYNINDLDTTIDLYNAIESSIQLRYDMSEQYQMDLMSKGDAQIAEAVVLKELNNLGIKTNKKIILPEDYNIQYKAPECIHFESEELNQLLSFMTTHRFVLDGRGSPKLPEELSKKDFIIGGNKYKVGLGGLHSKEKKLVAVSTEDFVMRNADVASYYPSMIIEFGYKPQHLGEAFLNLYKKFYITRLKAKKEKNMVLSDSLKLTLNGVFGKFGNKWSKIYSPDLMLQVTLTGQLMLLMLIEQLTLNGFEVVSSNTDGIEYKCLKSRQDLAEAIIWDWELETGMIMEHGVYQGLYARDVNNYIAIYDGYYKAKGAYKDLDLRKNIEYEIVYLAIKKYLMDKTPMMETIKSTNDIRKFLIGKRVTGGGIWKDEFLGKVVRWYYSTQGEQISYHKNGNKVGKSEGAKPLMDLPPGNKIPKDLNYDFYLELAIKHLNDLGVDYVN